MKQNYWMWTIPMSLFLLSAILFVHCGGSNTRGTLDTSFGGTGKITTDFSSGPDLGYGIALQGDGKILVAGAAFNGSFFDFALARYESNGNLDTSFGTGGKVTTSLSSVGDDIAHSIALQSDGKMVLGGVSKDGLSKNFAVARYLTNGTLDTTFASNGFTTTDFNADDDEAREILIQSDGKIILAGFAKGVTNTQFAVARFSTAGAADPSFSADGKVSFSISTAVDAKAHAAALQSDGKLVLAGTSGTTGNLDLALAKLNSIGILDPLFGESGTVSTEISSSNEEALGISILSNNRILVSGYTTNESLRDFLIAKYLSTGVLDSSFGVNGSNTNKVCATASDTANDIQADSLGDIVIAGTSDPGSSSGCTDIKSADFALSKYINTGSLSKIFASDGIASADFSSLQDEAHALAIQGDNKILIAGFSSNGSNFDFAVARYNR